MSMYCKYTNRNTNALSEYIEDLKSYKNFELGFDLVLNLTDKLYDFTYLFSHKTYYYKKKLPSSRRFFYNNILFANKNNM